MVLKIDSKKVVSKYLEYASRKERNNEKPLPPEQWLWHVMDLLNIEELLKEKYSITDSGDCFHIKMHIAAFPKNRESALKVIEKIFE